MKKRVFKGYVAGADIASGIPAHLVPVVAGFLVKSSRLGRRMKRSWWRRGKR